MADRLDVVPVWVAHEGAVVMVVVLGEDPGAVEHLGPDAHRGLVKSPDRATARRPKGDVELPVFGPMGRAEPKGAGFGSEEPHGCSVPMAGGNPQRGQHDLVEGGAGGDTGHLQRDVIDHVFTFAPLSTFTPPGGVAGHMSLGQMVHEYAGRCILMQ